MPAFKDDFLFLNQPENTIRFSLKIGEKQALRGYRFKADDVFMVLRPQVNKLFNIGKLKFQERLNQKCGRLIQFILKNGFGLGQPVLALHVNEKPINTGQEKQ